METPHRYCTFYLGDYLFGVTLIQVQEVIRQQPMTPVPLAPPQIAGLINLRGQIITALNLRKLLLLEERPEKLEEMNVIIRSGEELISLQVDAISDVLELRNEDCERPPDRLSPQIREYITGVHKLPNRLLLVLNCAQMASNSVSFA